MYGMEWLSKNGRTEKQNKELVAKNPFLPYSIIMERTVFERLAQIDEELYTGFPIPVIIRDELENTMDAVKGPVTTAGKIHFSLCLIITCLIKMNWKNTCRYPWKDKSDRRGHCP